MLRPLVLAACFSAVLAQTPPYLGKLLIKTALSTQLCLTATSNNDGAAVNVQTCTNDASQQWLYSGGSIVVFDDKCLDVTDGNSNDGALLQVWSCASGNPNQQFFYDRGSNRLKWPSNEKCLQYGKTNDTGRPTLWECVDQNDSEVGSQLWNSGYWAGQLPDKSQEGQYGTNNCVGGASQTANCQTLWLNDATDFCLFAPPNPNSTIGDTEAIDIAVCLKAQHSARLFPDGTLQGVHFVRASDYVQITGIGDFTKINIQEGDEGGENDNRGSNAIANPDGGLVYGNTFFDGTQYHEWTQFISYTQFCIRACIGPNATINCNHRYDIMGCDWNIPGNYDPGFEQCDSPNALPMGVYGTSTWTQGESPTPSAHPAPSSSNCTPFPTVTSDPLSKKRNLPRRSLEERFDPKNIPHKTRAFLPRETAPGA